MSKQTFTTGQVLTASQMTSLQQTAMGGGSPSTKTTSYVLVAADAGTVIQMNSASATTITVNTSLFSAGDSVQIQNIGSGTTTITNGTATVHSAGSLGVTQYDGGFLYFSSASSAIWFDYTQAGTTLPLTTKGDLFGYDTANARIPIGTNNQVLTADSTQALGLKWATPGGGGSSWSLLNTGGTALTGAATITVSGISGKDKILVCVDAASSVNASSEFKFLINGVTTNSYGTFGGTAKSTSTASDIIAVQSGFDIAIYFATSTQSRADGIVAGALSITGANSSGQKAYISNGGANGPGSNVGHRGSFAQGVFDSSSTVSSISVTSGNGNFDSGTVYVYTSVS